MKLRLTRPASRQLDQVLDYIATHSPQGARNVQARIQAIMLLLLEQPEVGSETERPGIRRFVVSPYPYALTYEATENEIRHTSRRLLT